MADSDKQILITPNISATSYPQIKFVGKDNAPMYQTVQDDGTIAFSGAQGEVFSIGPTMALGTIFSANDISGVPLFKVLASGAVNVSSGRLCVGTDTPVDGMALTLNGDGTAYEGIAWQVDGATKWKMSTDSSGFYWDSQVNTMDINFRLRDSGGTQQKFRFTADGGTNSPKFVVGASAHTIPDGQAGIEIIDSGQSTLRVTDSDGNASGDFAQSASDTYIINRVTNGDIKFRVNSSNELLTLDGGTQAITQVKTTFSGNVTSTSANNYNLYWPLYFQRDNMGTSNIDMRLPVGGSGTTNPNNFAMPRAGKVMAFTVQYYGGSVTLNTDSDTWTVRRLHSGGTEVTVDTVLVRNTLTANYNANNLSKTVELGSPLAFNANDTIAFKRTANSGAAIHEVNAVLWIQFDL